MRVDPGWLASILVGISAGCGSGPEPLSPPILKIAVTPETTTVAVGGFVQLEARVVGMSSQVAFLWRSRDAVVAEVSPGGLVRAKATGRTVIVAKPVTDTMAEGGAEIIVR